MQSLNRKEIASKILLILISILSILLITKGIQDINSSMGRVENMGGFEFYPIDSSDTVVQGWYYSIITSVLYTLCPIMILIVSVISLFIKNRIVETLIVSQTFLMLLLELPANFDVKIIENNFYLYIVIAVVITLIVSIVSTLKKNFCFVFYIMALGLLIVKYINVFSLWFDMARETSLLSWFDMYGLKYAFVTVLGFVLLLLKQEKRSITGKSSDCQNYR